MKSIWVTGHGGPEVLELREGPDPVPAADEVRVRVAAAGVNFAEIMARKGFYPDAPHPPCVLGYEGAGVVDSVGAGVRGLAVGDRVVYVSRFSGQADLVCVPHERVYKMPASMSFEEAAALPVNYLTAYHMLFRVTRIAPGDHVLIHMAAGGVGTALIQLCRTVPDVTTYGTCSAGKHDYVREQGLMHVIDYHTQDYIQEITRLTHGRGVDFVYNALGGRDWSRDYSVLRPGGTLVAFGIANASNGERRGFLRLLKVLAHSPILTPIKLMNDNKGYAGVNMGRLFGETAVLREAMMALFSLYERGKIRPHVDQTFPFSQVREAFASLEHHKNSGKVLLRPDAV
ncbi:MAG: medium chain dehydrogenase/reductase family protein [Myxococcales bacterium]